MFLSFKNNAIRSWNFFEVASNREICMDSVNCAKRISQPSGIDCVKYQLRKKSLPDRWCRYLLLIDGGVFVSILKISIHIWHVFDPPWTLSLSILGIRDDSNLGHPWPILPIEVFLYSVLTPLDSSPSNSAVINPAISNAFLFLFPLPVFSSQNEPFRPAAGLPVANRPFEWARENFSSAKNSSCSRPWPWNVEMWKEWTASFGLFAK